MQGIRILTLGRCIVGVYQMDTPEYKLVVISILGAGKNVVRVLEGEINAF